MEGRGGLKTRETGHKCATTGAGGRGKGERERAKERLTGGGFVLATVEGVEATRQVAHPLVAGAEGDGQQQGDEEGQGPGNAGPAEDDAEVVGVPGEEHLPGSELGIVGVAGKGRLLTFMLHMLPMSMPSWPPMPPWSIWEWSMLEWSMWEWSIVGRSGGRAKEVSEVSAERVMDGCQWRRWWFRS